MILFSDGGFPPYPRALFVRRIVLDLAGIVRLDHQRIEIRKRLFNDDAAYDAWIKLHYSDKIVAIYRAIESIIGPCATDDEASQLMAGVVQYVIEPWIANKNVYDTTTDRHRSHV